MYINVVFNNIESNVKHKKLTFQFETHQQLCASCLLEYTSLEKVEELNLPKETYKLIQKSKKNILNKISSNDAVFIVKNKYDNDSFFIFKQPIGPTIASSDLVGQFEKIRDICIANNKSECIYEICKITPLTNNIQTNFHNHKQTHSIIKELDKDDNIIIFIDKLFNYTNKYIYGAKNYFEF